MQGGFLLQVQAGTEGVFAGGRGGTGPADLQGLLPVPEILPLIMEEGLQCLCL